MKKEIVYQVVHKYQHTAMFDGTYDECLNFINGEGIIGNSIYDILPYDKNREHGDLLDAY